MSKADIKTKGSFWLDALAKFGLPTVFCLWLMFGVSPKLDKLIELGQQTVELLKPKVTASATQSADAPPVKCPTTKK